MRTWPLAIGPLLVLLSAAACGKEASDRDATPPRSSTGVPSTVPPPLPPAGETSPAPATVSYTGVLRPLGPSIYMQGTHRLTDGDLLVAILESKTVDLATYEGKKVTVTGPARPTVEGDQTIVDVREIREVP